MGRKGWAGAPPADDDEARKRIIDATLRIVDRRGAAQTTVSDVADALGITRRTVYRYFAGTEELFTAVAEVALGSFVARSSITRRHGRHRQLVEVVAYIIERLPHEPQLTLLLANDRSNSFSRTMLAPDEIARCRAILQHTHIDWAALGLRRPHHRRTRRVPAAHHPVDGHRAAGTAPLGSRTARLSAALDRTSALTSRTWRAPSR